MICRDLNLLFIHVPKTAGQAMEQYILNGMGLDWKKDKARMLCKKNRWPWKGPFRLAHLTAQEYLDYNYLSQEEFDKMFKFAFVRNPWARMVSYFVYAGHGEKYSFDDWLVNHFPTPKDEKWPMRKSGYRMIMPQTDYILDADGKLIVDYVGKFENINDDFQEACKLAGLPAGELPSKNVSKKSKHYSEYYTPELRARVAEIYALEIEMFDYTFEG